MTDPLILGLLLAATVLLILGGVLLGRGHAGAGSTVLSLVLLLIVGGNVEAIGQPKPVWLELPWCKAGDTVRVRYGQAVEPTAILLQVDTPCGPRWWSMPWTLQDAQQLQDAQRGAKAAAGKGRPGPLRMRLTGGQDPREPKFWPEPQPAPPPKERPPADG